MAMMKVWDQASGQWITVLGQDLSSKADVNHSHDSMYFTEAEVTAFLNDKANLVHNHNADYYTEGEIDNKLVLKSDTTHNHDTAYYTKAQVDSAIAAARVPTLYQVSSAGNTNFTDNVYKQVDGLTQSVTVAAGSILSVDVSLDIQSITGTNPLFIGQLEVDGVAQTGQILHQHPTTSRMTLMTHWDIPGLSAGAHTVRVMGRQSAASGTQTTTRGPGQTKMDIKKWGA